MKILHTADWHLGKRLERFERLEEQRQVMEEICQIAEDEDVQAVLVAGDLFDTYSPSTEATHLLYRTLKRLSADGRRPVIAIAGNHDSPERIEAPDPLALECGIFFAGYPHTQVTSVTLESGLQVTATAPGLLELSIPGVAFPLRILLAPYANEGRIRKDLGTDQPDAALRAMLQAFWAEIAEKHCDTNGLNVMVAHLWMAPESGTAPEEDSDEEKSLGTASQVFTTNIPPAIQYAALGHIHSHFNVPGGPCPAVYASSPLAYSFPKRGSGEATSSSKHIVIVEGQPGTPVTYRAVPLQSGRKLHRLQFPDVATALDWLNANPDTYVELHIETDSFLTAEERKLIMTAHPRV
ncbi:MAG: exonuclease SbcCD subunit D, partial [Bacteroidia bacterium]